MSEVFAFHLRNSGGIYICVRSIAGHRRIHITTTGVRCRLQIPTEIRTETPTGIHTTGIAPVYRSFSLIRKLQKIVGGGSSPESLRCSILDKFVSHGENTASQVVISCSCRPYPDPYADRRQMPPGADPYGRPPPDYYSRDQSQQPARSVSAENVL